MPRSSTPLVQEPSSRQLVDDWLALHRLSPVEADTVLRLEGVLPGAPQWHRFLLVLTRLAGVLACTAAVVFFIAFNWQDLPRAAKFMLLETALIACAIGGWWRGLTVHTRQAALVGAMLLCGALLAFVGQTYQTGADPYQLFFSWALLILPWVIAARLAAAWVAWLLLLNLALSLFVGRASGVLGAFFDHAFGAVPLFWLNVCVWTVSQWLTRGRSPHAIERAAAALMCAYASISLISWIFVGRYDIAPAWEWFSRVVALITLPAMLVLYRTRRDALVLSAVCSSLIACSLALVVHTASSELRADQGVFWIAGCYLILGSALAAAWLRKTMRGWRLVSAS